MHGIPKYARRGHHAACFGQASSFTLRLEGIILEGRRSRRFVAPDPLQVGMQPVKKSSLCAPVGVRHDGAARVADSHRLGRGPVMGMNQLKKLEGRCQTRLRR